ncbi:MAG: class I adenylate-forming enzyme family protein [Alcanivorax sp.]|uniref:class I adenylate-forming enzyme family protein n=1 Tax=Alcanivorax sp. TaxID=1872427 RepID=UPI003C5F7487
MKRTEAIARLTAPGEPSEIIEGKLWGRPCRMFRNTPRNLRELFESTRSDATFLVYDSERYTFDETQRAAARVSNLLINRYGIRKGDRVAISMRNFPEWVFAYNAITSIGAIAVALNALWEPEEMAFGLEDCGARVLFADQERLDRLATMQSDHIPEVIAVRPRSDLSPGIENLADLIQDESDDFPDATVEPDDPATIFYTSGSTGHPKGAVSCHGNILNALWSGELEGQVGPMVSGVKPPERDYQLAALLGVPLFHATGNHAVILRSYRLQRKVVSMYRWDAERALDLIEAERIATVIAPSTVTGDLVRAAENSSRDLSSLRAVGGGGAARSPEQVRNIDRTLGNAVPVTGWGMTETNSIGTGIGGEDYLQHPGSSGRPSAVVDLRVVDENGDPLPAGERGELQVRGATIIQGYWNNPEATAEAFDGDWLKTGDIAYLDDEGYLYIVDRIKDLVIRGGENIGCAEVEAALLEHPDVLEAAVYAVPDERLGEEVGATVHVANHVDAEALRSFLKGHIAGFKIPRYISFMSVPLPRLGSGKIDKRSVRGAFVDSITQ